MQDDRRQDSHDTIDANGFYLTQRPAQETARKTKNTAKPASYQPNAFTAPPIGRLARQTIGITLPHRTVSLYTVYKNMTPVKGIIRRRRRPAGTAGDRNKPVFKASISPLTLAFALA